MAEPNFEKGTMSYPVEYYLLDDGSWLLKNFIPFQLEPTCTHTSTLLPFINGYEAKDEIDNLKAEELMSRAVSKCTISFQFNRDFLVNEWNIGKKPG